MKEEVIEKNVLVFLLKVNKIQRIASHEEKNKAMKMKPLLL